jgi:hypothetical protein
MKHYLPNLRGRQRPLRKPLYSTSFRKHPQSSSRVSITIHEAGKAGGAYTAREAWPPSSKSVADIAKLVAHKIVGMYNSHAGRVFKRVTLDF